MSVTKKLASITRGSKEKKAVAVIAKEPTAVITLMTADEAHSAHNQLKHLHNVVRELLLQIRDRKGYLHLGYQTFAEYGEHEWGYSQSYIHRLATAHATQQLVAPNSPDIPETQLRPLASVPDVDKKRIYAEVKTQCDEEHKKLTAKLIADAVTKYQADNTVLQAQLNTMESQLSTEFQAKIDDLNDELSRAKQKLAQTQSTKKEVDTLMNTRADLLNQIDIANLELAELNAQQNLKKQQEQYNTALRLFATDIKHAITHSHLNLYNLLSEDMTLNNPIDDQTTNDFVNLSEQLEKFLTIVRSVRTFNKNHDCL